MSIKALSLQCLQVNREVNRLETLSLPAGKPASKPGYDRVAELDRVHRELEAAGPWPESLHQWLATKPDLAQQIRDTSKAVDDAFYNESGDMEAILTEYRDSHLAALGAYREMQSQESLF